MSLSAKPGLETSDMPVKNPVAKHSIALIGYGKMGRAIEQLAKDAGIAVAAVFDHGHSITTESLNGAEVAIEFTQPDSAVANIKKCVDLGIPVVVGTTGWNDSIEEVRQYVNANNGTMLSAANFSIGVNIFAEIVKFAAERFGHLSTFDAHLIESHHTAKKDSPSGTGLMLKAAAMTGLKNDLPITSYRVGSVPGTHELVFDAQYEQITLSHVARDRKVFAQGALEASQWLVGKKGVLSISDMLGINSTSKAD